MAGNTDERSMRTNYIDWEHYFMGVALIAAERSKDPNRQVGACIVSNDKKIVGVGYNSMPWKCDDKKFPWNKEQKSLYVSHAELNAIVNKNMSDLKNCTLYVTLFPCNECAKLIIQSGLKEIIYLSDHNMHKPKCQASIKMFEAAGVTFRQFVGRRDYITLYFNQEERETINLS